MKPSRDVISWLKCMYMQQMIGQQFRGTITGCNSAGLYITLDDVFVDGFMHISKLGREYFVFDEIPTAFGAKKVVDTLKWAIKSLFESLKLTSMQDALTFALAAIRTRDVWNAL